MVNYSKYRWFKRLNKLWKNCKRVNKITYLFKFKISPKNRKKRMRQKHSNLLYHQKKKFAKSKKIANQQEKTFSNDLEI